MNTFAVKAIILSAIVAYYGQCEGSDYHYAVTDGQQVDCYYKGEKAVAACCVGGTLVCPETRTRKWQNSKEICLDQGGALCEYTQLQNAPNSCGDTQWSLTECDPAHSAHYNSRESIASPMTVSTSNGAESGFDVVSAMIGCAVGAVLMLLAVYVVIVVKRKRMSAKSDEEAIVKEQTEDQVQATPANVVAVVETVIETEME